MGSLSHILVLLSAIHTTVSAGRHGIQCKMDLCGVNCGPERPPPCGTADPRILDDGGMNRSSSSNGGSEDTDEYLPSAQAESQQYRQHEGNIQQSDFCEEAPLHACPIGYNYQDVSGECVRESYVSPEYACGGSDGSLELVDGKYICVKQLYMDVSMECAAGYLKIFNGRAKYGHSCSKMAFADFEAMCVIPSYSITTDSNGDSICRHAEVRDPAEPCEDPYTYDEMYDECKLENITSPSLQCPYNFLMKDGRCMREIDNSAPQYTCEKGYPDGPNCITGYQTTEPATASCLGDYTLDLDSGKCIKYTWQDADAVCEHGYNLQSQGGETVCANKLVMKPESKCGAGFMLDDQNVKCVKERTMPAYLRCSSGYKRHNYLPKCFKIERHDLEPHCTDEGYQVEGESEGVRCHKELIAEPSSACRPGYEFIENGCYARFTVQKLKDECREGYELRDDGKCIGPCTSNYNEAPGDVTSNHTGRHAEVGSLPPDSGSSGAQGSEFDIAPLI